MNSARGANALSLGDLLSVDGDGTRTELVVPSLSQLAGDPVLSVRSCVAHVLGAIFRHAPAEATASFWQLIEPRNQVLDERHGSRGRVLNVLKTLRAAIKWVTGSLLGRPQPHPDDVILTSDLVQQLLFLVGSVDAAEAMPVIDRMLVSDVPDVRRTGGRMAVFAGLEWGCGDLLSAATNSRDRETRVGGAQMASQRLALTASRSAAAASLQRLFNDSSHEVRAAAASVAPNLRGLELRPYAPLISSLVESLAYAESVPQLLITLQHAPDRIDDLALEAAQQFIAAMGDQISDIRTGAAGDVHYITELVLRGLAQTEDPAERSALLDVIDSMIRLGAYGIEDAIEDSGR